MTRIKRYFRNLSKGILSYRCKAQFSYLLYYYSKHNSNGYITEYVLPQTCEMLSTKTYDKPIFLCPLLTILILLKQHDDDSFKSKMI